MDIVGVVVCTSGVVKMRNNLPFCWEFSMLCINKDLLLTILSNFEREAAQHFWWVASLTHKVTWYEYSLKINLIGLTWNMVWYINICGGVWSNRVGQNRETYEEHDGDCLEEGFQLTRVKFGRDGETGRKALDIGKL